MNASRSQVRWIHILKSKLGLSEESYRAMLGSYGVRSSKDLPMKQACHLVQRMEHEAVSAGVWMPSLRDTGRFSTLQGRPDMASPAQLRHIEGLWAYVSRQPTAEMKKESLHRWLGRRFHIARLEWLTEAMVPKVLYALDAMVKQKEEADGQGANGDTGDGRCVPAVQAGASSGSGGQCGA